MQAATDMAKSYTAGPRGIQAKSYRPKTKREAREMVESVFEKNRWDERSQRVYLESKGVPPKPLEECTVGELRILIDAMEEKRMIIFADE